MLHPKNLVTICAAMTKIKEFLEIVLSKNGKAILDKKDCVITTRTGTVIVRQHSGCWIIQWDLLDGKVKGKRSISPMEPHQAFDSVNAVVPYPIL